MSTLSRYQRRHKRQAPAVRNALLAVEVCDRGPEPAQTGSALAVVLRGGRRVEVGRGFDAGTLEQLVHVLEGV